MIFTASNRRLRTGHKYALSDFCLRPPSHSIQRSLKDVSGQTQLSFPTFQRLAAMLFFLSLSFPVHAQENLPEMADLLRSNGKIYVVVFVIVTIFVGIILYLFRLERKMKQLEEQIGHDEPIPSTPFKQNT